MKMCFFEICNCDGSPVASVLASRIESVRYDWDAEVSTVRTFSGDSFSAKGNLNAPIMEALLDMATIEDHQDDIATFEIYAENPKGEHRCVTTVNQMRRETEKRMQELRKQRRENARPQ